MAAAITMCATSGKLVNFHPRGQVELSGRSYYTIIKIDTDSLRNQVAPISEALEEIEVSLSSKLSVAESHHKKKLEGNDSDPMEQILTMSMKDHLTFLSRDLLDRQEALTNFLKSLGKFDFDQVGETKSRRARGLLDAGGQLLSYVFGTALDSDVRSNEEILQRLEDLSEEQRQQINLHKQILNTTAMHLDRVTTQINRVSTCLGAVQENIRQLNNHLRDNSRYSFTLANSMVMSSSLSYASTALADLTTQILNLKVGLNTFKSGYLSPEIVPPETILALAETIQNDNLRPLYPANERYLPQYYKYIKVWPLPHDSLSFVLELPLTGDPAIRLNLFEIIAVPHPVGGRLVLSYTNLPKYLAISSDRSLYQERNTLDTCRNYEESHVCPIDAPIYKDTTHSCIVALYRGEDTPSGCQKHFAAAPSRPELVKTSIGWMYSTSKDLEVTVTCSKTVTNTLLSPGSGILLVADNCKVSSNGFILPSSAEAKGSIITRNISLVAPFKVNLHKEELESLKMLNETPILRDVMELTNNQLPLASLKGVISKLGYIKRMCNVNTISAHTGLTLATIALIISIVLIIGAGCVCRITTLEREEIEGNTPDAAGRGLWLPRRDQVRIITRVRRRSMLDVYPVQHGAQVTDAMLLQERTEPLNLPTSDTIPRSPPPIRERMESVASNPQSVSSNPRTPTEQANTGKFFPNPAPRQY